tara:strand:+ start:4954 stop:5670 length:717 start_codon:yes stop_codon:yes gene_type:complete
MDLIPAIDIRGGNCVRLFKGDYSKETIFSENPLDVAIQWKEEGATRIHIVDLDGAKDGKLVNNNIIEQIADISNIKIQVGGGIRNLSAVKEYFELGVDRLILGTAAVDTPDLVKSILDYKGPDSLIVSIDAKNGHVALDGWTRIIDMKVNELIHDMMELGVIRCLYTDINRDGTLTEPNYDSISDLVNFAEVSIIAAGGISTIEALLKLKDIGVESAVVGKAIYTNDLNLKKAIQNLK